MDEERKQETNLKIREDTSDQDIPSGIPSETDSSIDNKEKQSHSIICGDLESIDLNDTSTDDLSATVTDSPTSIHSSINQSGKKKRLFKACSYSVLKRTVCIFTRKHLREHLQTDFDTLMSVMLSSDLPPSLASHYKSNLLMTEAYNMLVLLKNSLLLITSSIHLFLH